MFGVGFSPRQASWKRSGLRPGYYTIQSLAKSCGTSYLSTDKTGKRVKLQSAAAKAPGQWLVLPKAGDKAGDKEYTLRPKSGANIGGGTSAKLSYSKACSSSSTKLSSKGLMSWTVRYAPHPDGKSSYTIGAASKPTESTRDGRCPALLGCSSSSKEGRGASPALILGSPRSPETAWMLRFVRAISQPPSPPVVLIEVVSITLSIADETVESFGQAKQDALCSTIVAASGDPTAECRVTSVVPKGAGGRRRVMQDGGITVDTRTTFVTPVTDNSGGGGGGGGGENGGGSTGVATLLSKVEKTREGEESIFGDTIQVEKVEQASAEVPTGTPPGDVDLTPQPASSEPTP